MEEDIVKCSVSVPYNHEVMVASRRKMNIISAIAGIFGCAFMSFLVIMTCLSEGVIPALVIICGGMAVGFLIWGISYLFALKPQTKNESKIISYIFHEAYLEIYQENTLKNKKKRLTACLYEKYANKQYVSKVIETETALNLKVFVGTTNGMPNYKNYTVPKDVFNPKELKEVTQILQYYVGTHYQFKDKK